MSMLAPLFLAPWAGLVSPAPTQDAPLVSMWIEDAGACLQNPKDAGLVAALRLVTERVQELPAELPDFPPLPPEAIDLAAHVLTGRKSFRLFLSDDPNLMLPVYAQLEMQEGGAEAAARLADTFLGLLGGMGAPLGDAPTAGLRALQTPMGVPLELGALDDRFVLSLGKVLAEPGRPATVDLPEGARPMMSMHMDVGRALEFAFGMAAMGSPDEAEQMMRVMETFGLQDMQIDMTVGADAERTYAVSRLPGYAGTMREMGMMPARGLAKTDLALVPADAAWASLGTIEAQGTLDMVLALLSEQLGEAGMEDPVEALAAMTGINVRTDLVDHLGTVYGVYTSDTTGGGGLFSMVGFLELANAEGMLGTLERLQDLVDGIGAAEADGYVRSRSWQHGETELFTLTFPGIPIPVEPTIAVTGTHMVVGITPQATLAALGQMAAGGPGLLANENFVDGLAADVDGAYSVVFTDTPRLLRDGYGLTSLLCSAIVNGTRSPRSVERDAGVILPPYHELAKGARASVTLTRVEGEDFVGHGRSDSSMLVNLAGGVGMLTSSPAGLVFPMVILGSTTATRYEATEEWEPVEGEDW